MKKLLLLIGLVVLLVSSLTWAEDLEKINRDKIMIVSSDIDGFCFYTKKLIDESILLIKESCEDFLNFNKSVYEIDPYKAQLPISAEVVSIDYEKRTISKSIIKDGIEIGPHKITKNDKLFYQGTYYKDGSIKDEQYYNINGWIELRTLVNRENNNRINKEYIFFNDKEIILHLLSDFKNNSMEIKYSRIDLSQREFFEIDLSNFYFKFNLLDGYINNQFVEFNKNIPSLLIKNYKKGIQDGFEISFYDENIINNKHINLTIFSNGQKLIYYRMSDKELTSETSYKDGLKHGIDYYFLENLTPYAPLTRCYEKGKEIEVKDCDRDYLYQERENLRNLYFYKNGMQTHNVTSEFRDITLEIEKKFLK